MTTVQRRPPVPAGPLPSLPFRKKSSWTQKRYERGGPRTVASAFSLSYPTEHAPPPECPLKASWLSYRKLTTLCPRYTFKVKAVMAATEENNIF